MAIAMLAASARPAQASLLTGYEAQLATWIGEGPLEFTSLYEKQSGDSTTDFHLAVDGQGATFTLLEAIILGQTYVIGGYNPQSWSSDGIFNSTPADDNRLAFIYNLTTGAVQAQRPTSDDLSWGGYGAIQTYNDPDYGPSFGSSDLILSSLNTGTAVQLSYGTAGSACGWGGRNIVGTIYLTASCDYTNEPYDFTVGALEVYTFTPQKTDAVPDRSATLMLFGAGLLGLVAVQRRVLGRV